MHPSIKPAFAQHIRHQAGRTDKTDGGFHVSSEIHRGYQNNGNDFGL
jgi:hypothetical protein